MLELRTFRIRTLGFTPCEATHLLVCAQATGFGHETKLKKRGKYTIEFYLFAELKYDLPSACVDRCMYYRKSYFEFVQGFDLTAGYIKVCRVEESRLRRKYFKALKQ
jgi:hypothetical protein